LKGKIIMAYQDIAQKRGIRLNFESAAGGVSTAATMPNIPGYPNRANWRPLAVIIAIMLIVATAITIATGWASQRADALPTAVNDWPVIDAPAPVVAIEGAQSADALPGMIFALDQPWTPGSIARVRLGDGRLVCLNVAHPNEIGAIVYAAMRGEMEMELCQ
jgi:hypothetical protein